MSLSEVTSDVLQPLLLPISEYDQRSEDAALLEVKKLVFRGFSDLDISSLLSTPLHVGFQNDIGHSKHSALLCLLLLVHECIQSALEVCS